MKIHKVIWFSSGRGLIGIVHATQDDGDEGYYIAPCDGFNEVIDANMVAVQGARFPEAAGLALFGGLND
ncbi:hypothetical protein UFOVP126_63 [uncultured Caudovirales phage]|uniref:Uncharacterized protein n=1 Tax=uncultured Caudovirales phage TaxID=2100421 RepID=A0A6J5LB73_9CAUD|nr:hypothetical protein UFOVP126_63 [uncultured Caudovirales phage]